MYQRTQNLVRSRHKVVSELSIKFETRNKAM
jgi:hypothetical protein